MTLLQIRNALIELLTTQDTITADNFGDVELPKELDEHRDALLRTALADLSEAGMLRPLLRAKESQPSMWVLTSPLGAAGCDLSISLPTCAAVADEINAYKDGCQRDDWPVADALQINEQSILMLLGIIADLRDPGGNQEPPTPV